MSSRNLEFKIYENFLEKNYTIFLQVVIQGVPNTIDDVFASHLEKPHQGEIVVLVWRFS